MYILTGMIVGWSARQDYVFISKNIFTHLCGSKYSMTHSVVQVTATDTRTKTMIGETYTHLLSLRVMYSQTFWNSRHSNADILAS